MPSMLPRVGLRVEEQLRQASNATQTQYEALKTYLMLHDVQHFDSDRAPIGAQHAIWHTGWP